LHLGPGCGNMGKATPQSGGVGHEETLNLADTVTQSGREAWAFPMQRVHVAGFV